MPEIIIGIVLLIVCLGYGIFCLVKLDRFIRDHKVCPRCGDEMKVVWVGREVDARKEKIRFGGQRVIGGTVTQYTPLLRCKHCGHEIPLVSNNSERG